MFETTYLQVAKACDQKRRDFHERTKLALVSQADSHENQDEEEEYDWSENNDVVSIQEIEKKDEEISNLSETIAKQDEKIVQLNSEIKRLMSEKETEKDVNSSYICDKLKKEEQMHKNLKEQHEISDQRITSLEESLKKSEREAMNVKNEAAKSNEHSSSVIKDLQEEILKLKKLSEMFNSENNILKTKLQEEQEKHASLQEDHKMCEDRFKSLTQDVDSMLIEKHNLNVQLMELTDKLNRSQSDLVKIKEEVETTKSSEQEKEGLVPTGIVGSLSSQEEEEKTQEVQSKKKKKKVRRKKSKARKNKTKATSSDSTPQTPSTSKSQDSESPSDSNSVFPFGSKSDKFKTPASSSKLQQDSEVKAPHQEKGSTAKASQNQRKKSPFKAHQKYCEICQMYNHTTTECYYNKYCTNCQMYNHDTMECYYNKYCSFCDMVNHNTSECYYKPRRSVQRSSSCAYPSRYFSNFKRSNHRHSFDENQLVNDSWTPKFVKNKKRNHDLNDKMIPIVNQSLNKKYRQQNLFLKEIHNLFENDYNYSFVKQSMKEDEGTNYIVSSEPPPEGIPCTYENISYVDEFGRPKTEMISREASKLHRVTMQSIQCDEPHRELLSCGIQRPEVSHEVSFELQGAAKDSKMEQKESQMRTVTKQIPKWNSEYSQGEHRQKEKFQKGIQKKSQSGPNPNRTQIPHCL
ncbi:hypothetical protein QVD17_41697 [Tagetes erecta]|uniref:Uncharacterized protein n=1 Tax=Tagetes erecta TaxID=13708 RepID=A0AAD8JKY5_TARER|nr:hypothetical protein QVD17_41697 [Tagetes erecta]